MYMNKGINNGRLYLPLIGWHKTMCVQLIANHYYFKKTELNLKL